MYKPKKQVKRTIKYKKERVVLSDILPYEVPITFSNRYFYDFLVENGICLKDNTISWTKTKQGLEEAVRLIFDLRSHEANGNSITINEGKGFKTIPFNFKVSHKDNDFRMLTIVHPKNQLALVNFYERYKFLIIHFANQSPFSIRKPVKVAKAVYALDKTHSREVSKFHEFDSLEESGQEYINLKTFFVYKNYSNIHKFYESYKYHRCEKKYNNLYSFDISKCFDSIYSHSISWSLHNKKIVKDYLKFSKGTFGSNFDSLMQNLNYSETNGIVIGPEFSRIFAELILQRVDRNVELVLKNQNPPIVHKLHYEVFRYVDDFFVFYNDQATMDGVLKEFRLQLKEFKLYLNDSKSVRFDKPIVTTITIAKHRITELLNTFLTQNNPNQDLENQEDSTNENQLRLNSNALIVKFKIILKETGIDYKDIINYTFALVERKLSRIFYSKEEEPRQTSRDQISFIIESLEFTFFLFSVSPRVNTTIRLCRIISLINKFISQKSRTSVDWRHLVYKKIYDEIYFSLQKNRTIEHTEVETLYLLITLSELGSHYWLDIETLIQYVRIERVNGMLMINGKMNYFVIVVLLFYMKNKKRYGELREFVKAHILSRFKAATTKDHGQDTELVLLLFDVISCPYLDEKFKKDLLNLYGIKEPSIQESVIKMRKYWFTKWSDFDFDKELNSKRSKSVY